MDVLMISVSIQIQRALSEAINEQVLPQIQARLGPISDKSHKSDGTSRPRDRNTDLKKRLIARSKVAQEMRFTEINFVKKMTRSLMTRAFIKPFF